MIERAGIKLVDVTGIEPVTPCLQSRSVIWEPKERLGAGPLYMGGQRFISSLDLRPGAIPPRGEGCIRTESPKYLCGVRN